MPDCFLFEYMEYLPLILSVVSIHLLAVISPGPDLIMTLKNSLTYSRKAGMWTSVGFGLGVMIHVFYCVAGLALIISQSILLFSIIKFIGAGYLMYIGYTSLVSKKSVIDVSTEVSKKDLTPFQAVKSGFLTNLLNPKATLFFLGLFTLVLSPTTPVPVVLIMSAIMVMNNILWYTLVAVFFTQKKVRTVFDRVQNIVNKIFGGFLIFFGIKIALVSSK